LAREVDIVKRSSER
jgi:hypothetical protein